MELMDYTKHTFEQLLEKIAEIEILNKALLLEKEQETRLDFAWSGNLGHWYWNVKTNSVVFNQLKVTVLGYSMEELPQKVNYQFFTEKLHPDDYQNTMDAMILHMQGKANVYETEYRIQAKDKSWKWFYDRGKITQRDSKGNPELISGIVFDITERKEQELNLQIKNDSIHNKLTSVDRLTNSCNQYAFNVRAKRLIESKTCKYAFIILDIENFKLINDLFGFNQGDLVLQHMAKVLSHHMCLNEVFAHISDDKFYILAEYDSKEKLEHRLEKITEDILTFGFSAEPNFKMAVISGVFIIDDSNISIETMSDRARLAASKMRENRNSSPYFYNDAIRIQAIKEHEIESEMHEALKNNDFKVYMQPKYDFITEKVVGAEALIRWQNPSRGIIQPNSFIPLFEKNGFVTQIDIPACVFYFPCI